MPETHPLYQATIDHLKADSLSESANALTGGRIYSEQLPKDAELPAIRLALVGNDLGMQLAGASTENARLQLDVYGDRADGAKVNEIERAARSRLDRARLTATGYQQIDFVAVQAGHPFKEDNYYRVRSVYKIMGSL